MKTSTSHFRVRSLLLLSIIFIVITGFNTRTEALRIVGVWESEEKNLQIEIYEDDDTGLLSGRMIYFQCDSEEAMRNYKDNENPDEKLRDRNLLGMTVVSKLGYQGGNVWDDGKIYDPMSGRTFEARIELLTPTTANVRGYWKYKWLGRSMTFFKIQ